MKRKYKKTKKEHARRNATIKRKKRTRRQRGGAYIENVDLPYAIPMDKQVYKIVETDTYENGKPMYRLEGNARAIVIHPPCGVESRCDPLVSYSLIDGRVILNTYEPNGTPHRTYVGDFEDGKMHGRGKYTFHNTHPVFKEYEGEFEDGEMHGKGKMIMTNEDVYVGDFQDDTMHGKGTLTFTFSEDGSPDGSRYVGDFDNGRMHGHGKMYDDEGKVVFDGEFINNEPQYKVKQRKYNPGKIFEP